MIEIEEYLAVHIEFGNNGQISEAWIALFAGNQVKTRKHVKPANRREETKVISVLDGLFRRGMSIIGVDVHEQIHQFNRRIKVLALDHPPVDRDMAICLRGLFIALHIAEAPVRYMTSPQLLSEEHLDTSRTNIDFEHLAEWYGIKVNDQLAVTAIQIFHEMRRDVRVLIEPKKRKEKTHGPLAWVDLKHKLDTCVKCEIGSICKNHVHGKGEPFSNIMIVGEAPGMEEDKHGVPFYEHATAGSFLSKRLADARLTRDDVFISNAAHCHPPKTMNPEPAGNRTPSEAEIEACRPFLVAEIWNLRPKVIVCLGKVAMKAVLELGPPVRDLRMDAHMDKVEWYRYRQQRIPVLVEFHPAYIERQPSIEHIEHFKETLRKAKRIAEKAL